MGEGQAFFFNPTQKEHIQLWHSAGDTVPAPDIDSTTQVSPCGGCEHEFTFNPKNASLLQLLQTNANTPMQRVVWCVPIFTVPCTSFEFHQNHVRGPVELVVFSWAFSLRSLVFLIAIFLSGLWLF